MLDPGGHGLQAGGPAGAGQHRLRQQRRRKVDIGGRHPEQRVADAAADQACLGAGFVEGRQRPADIAAIEQGR